MDIEVHRIINKESPSYLHDLIKIKHTNYSFKYQNLAEVPSVKTTRYGLRYFIFFAFKLWNERSNHLTSKIIQPVQKFNKFLEWQLVSLQCVSMNLVF